MVQQTSKGYFDVNRQAARQRHEQKDAKLYSACFNGVDVVKRVALDPRRRRRQQRFVEIGAKAQQIRN